MKVWSLAKGNFDKCLYVDANHLSNVLVVFSDKRIPLCAGGTVYKYQADLKQAMHYSAFGAPLPDLRWYASSSQYDFGFNGKMEDDEVYGDGYHQDYGMRVYDPRLGRFLSVDPLAKEYPWYTPYQFAGNDVIRHIDLDGLEPALPQQLLMDVTKKLPSVVPTNKPSNNPFEHGAQVRAAEAPRPGPSTNPNLPPPVIVDQGTISQGGPPKPTIAGALLRPNPATQGVLGSFAISMARGTVEGANFVVQANNPFHEGGFRDLDNYPVTRKEALEGAGSFMFGLVTAGVGAEINSIKYSRPSKGLGNPFKDYTLAEVEKGFQRHIESGKLRHVFTNPKTGAKSYVNTRSGYSYNLDPGRMYGKKLEGPHIDVNYPNPKPINTKPKIKLPVAGGF